MAKYDLRPGMVNVRHLRRPVRGVQAPERRDGAGHSGGRLDDPVRRGPGDREAPGITALNHSPERPAESYLREDL